MVKICSKENACFKEIYEKNKMPKFLIIKEKAHQLFWYQFFQLKHEIYYELFKNKCMTMKETYRINLIDLPMKLNRVISVI